ncbi:MAG: 3'(2'),5'-bisphosphate nucleotidase CysQ [Nitrospirae bacterium]|nr:3'(2'),5'-bisphosphate nucleotidase CysQ [Nitrospirota bacterium]
MKIDISDLILMSRQAGEAIMEFYKTDHQIDYKDDNSPVTAADTAAHDIIMKGLKEKYGDIPCISEEGNLPQYDERKEWTYFWLVDPLDGTKEFIGRRGDFTVNIALINGDRPVIGVIYVPAKGLLYYASIDGGAWKAEGTGDASRIHVRNTNPSDSLIVVGSRLHSSKEEEQYIVNLKVKEKKSFGSSLKFCAVAEGAADIYPRFNPTMEWDTAAGQCIVEVAGGTVEDQSGRRLKYNKPSLKNDSFIVSGFIRK